MQRIAAVANKHKNWALVSLAVRTRLDSFKEVIAAMDTMMAELASQQKKEYEKWESCKFEIDKTEDTIKVEERTKYLLGEKHTSLVDKIDTLNKEIADLNKGMASMPWLSSAAPKADNLFEWEATLKGPEETPYEGGVFKVGVSFPSDFPFKPPTVKFETKIYHCNVSESGDVCMGLLKDGWSPGLRVDRVLKELRQLIASPNPDDPLDASIAAEFTGNRAEFDKKAAAWVRQYAKA